MNRLQSAYDSLGISADATLPEVRRAYRNLVRQWHPDRFANEPLRQHRALEMLKGINEAYELVMEDIAGRQNDYTSKLQEYRAPATVRSPEHTKAHSARRGTHSISEPLPLSSNNLFSCHIVTFFKAWQNLLFAAFVAGVICNSFVRFGAMPYGAVYIVEMLALPAILAIICNHSRLGRSKATWHAYVSIVCISFAIVLIDSIVYRNELKEASYYDASHPSEPAGGASPYTSGFPANPSGEGIGGRSSKAPTGPTPPRSPYVQAPSAPIVPEAPAAPIASPAR